MSTTTEDRCKFTIHSIKLPDFFRRYADILDKRESISADAEKRMVQVTMELKGIAFTELEATDAELESLRGERVER